MSGKKPDGGPVLKDGAAMQAGHVKSKAPCLGRECLADGGTENCVPIGFPNPHENIQKLVQFDNVGSISVSTPFELETIGAQTLQAQNSAGERLISTKYWSFCVRQRVQASRPSHPACSARMRTRTSAKGKTTRIKGSELFT